MNCEIPDVQAGFIKDRRTIDKIANICLIREKAREFQKNIYFCLIEYGKSFDCVDHNKLWKILKVMEYQTTLPASWEICMQVKKHQLEPDISPESSLEGLMLKLKLQFFGQLMWRTDSLEKTLMLEKTEGRRRKEWQEMRWRHWINGHEFEQTPRDSKG